MREAKTKSFRQSGKILCRNKLLKKRIGKAEEKEEAMLLMGKFNFVPKHAINLFNLFVSNSRKVLKFFILRARNVLVFIAHDESGKTFSSAAAANTARRVYQQT